MRIRNARLRTKIAALLVSLAALWAFAAWVTLRDSLNLLSVSTVDQKVTRPAVTLVTALQQERRLSLIYLGRPSAEQRQALDAQRARTDAAQVRFRSLAGSGDVADSVDDVLNARIREMFRKLDGLRTGRAAIDARVVDRQAANTTFDEITDAAFRIYRSAGASLSDPGIAADSRTLVSLTWAKEVLSREDALLAGALSAGRLTAAERARFAELVGAQRLLQQQAAADLPDEDRARYEHLVNTPTFARFRYLEDRVIENTRPNGRSPVSAKDWQSTVEPIMADLEKLTLTGGAGLVDRAKPVAVGVIVRLVLAGGLGLIAVIASVIVSITTARALVQQLQRLQKAAWELANERLPGVVERLGHGEKVDVAAEAPPLKFGSDEIGQVGRAFNSVQETAIRTAVEQAELRRGFRDVLLSLARRSQALVHRQLTLLDEMERRQDDPREVEDLFRVDHLATRMRRNAENLIVLSGATPARGWRRPVPMIDVVRAAVAEVEDYTRVGVPAAMGDIALVGRAVGDIVHLLAELIENAVSFSPPYTQAQISGRRVARGYAIEIEDRGLGMSDEILATLNERVSDPPEFNLTSSVHLGLYVVGQLAQRYDVRVSLKPSSYGGTTAVVLIPRELIVEVGSEDGDTIDRSAAQAVPVTAWANGKPAADATGMTAEPSLAKTPAAVTALTALEAPVGTAAPKTPTIPEPAQTGDDGDAEASTETLTEGGLPVRVPQASIAPPLRTDGPRTARADDDEEDPGRSPEEIRKSLGGLQMATRRGRSDAAKARGGSAADIDPAVHDEA